VVTALVSMLWIASMSEKKNTKNENDDQIALCVIWSACHHSAVTKQLLNSNYQLALCRAVAVACTCFAGHTRCSGIVHRHLHWRLHPQNIEITKRGNHLGKQW